MFLEDSQADMWWIPDFLDDTLEYEYTYLDLDGDEEKIGYRFFQSNLNIVAF